MQKSVISFTPKIIAQGQQGLALFSVLTTHAWALVETAPLLPPSLKTVAVPEPVNLSTYVKDKAAAIALGKALFWDNQVGSDGQACASCHYHAGVDHRNKNQINPGATNANGSISFDLTYSQTQQSKSKPKAGPNVALTATDFPFHRLADPYDRNSAIVYDSNDVIGSQGVFKRTLLKFDAFGKENCQSESSIFNVAGISVRQVTGRNAPSVINAAFNFRNFWDGRANNRFNGLNPFGDRQVFDSRSANNIYYYNGRTGALQPVQVQIDNASLASQAVGPALSSGEMTCAGMQFRYLGRKLLPLIPLINQTVDPTDSVLGPYAAKSYGLKTSYLYSRMVQDAFQPEFWSSTKKINGYTQMEQNFSLFWGLAIQLYEATLISNDSPYDQFREDPYNHSLTAQQVNGLNLFAGKGNCIACHRGAEFTAASRDHVTENYVERMLLNNSEVALYDTGFYNIGVRPTAEDLGQGGTDPFGNPLSYTRQASKLADGYIDPIKLIVDPVTINSWNFLVYTASPIAPQERDAVDGAFKTPGLRNIELTGPYFHNGAYGTLKETVVFYNRGGDRRNTANGDTSGFGANGSNLARDLAGSIDLLTYPNIIFPTLGLLDSEMDDIVEFLKTLTDERVRWEKAPFDHPSLPLLHGAKGSNTSVVSSVSNPKEAQDTIEILPAVGAGGRSVKNLNALGAF